jgi:hypothetical protein
MFCTFFVKILNRKREGEIPSNSGIGVNFQVQLAVAMHHNGTIEAVKTSNTRNLCHLCKDSLHFHREQQTLTPVKHHIHLCGRDWLGWVILPRDRLNIGDASPEPFNRGARIGDMIAAAA